MNELWMDLGYGFLYFQTNATKLQEAMSEFLAQLDSIGVNYDNFGWEEIELRGKDLYSIDGETMGAGCPKDLWQKGE